MTGQEARVIFISTVLSCRESLHSRPDSGGSASEGDSVESGFWHSPNVAIMRAKARLVVVGSPLVLVEDANWRELLAFCVGRGGYRGFGFSEVIDDLHSTQQHALSAASAQPASSGATMPSMTPASAAAAAVAAEVGRSETRTMLRKYMRQALLGSVHMDQQQQADLSFGDGGFGDEQPFRFAL